MAKRKKKGSKKKSTAHGRHNGKDVSQRAPELRAGKMLHDTSPEILAYKIEMPDENAPGMIAEGLVNAVCLEQQILTNNDDDANSSRVGFLHDHQSFSDQNTIHELKSEFRNEDLFYDIGLQLISQDEFTSAEISYRESVEFFFSKWSGSLVGSTSLTGVGATAAAGATLGGSGGMILALLLGGLTAGSSSANVASQAIREIKQVLLQNVHLIHGRNNKKDSRPLRISSNQDIMEAIISAPPHDENRLCRNLIYNDAGSMKHFFTSLVRTISKICLTSEREISRLLLRISTKIFQNLDLDCDRNLKDSVVDQRSIEVVRHQNNANMDFYFTVLDVTYSGNLNKYLCCIPNRSVKIEVTIRSWRFPSLESMMQAAEKGHYYAF